MTSDERPGQAGSKGDHDLRTDQTLQSASGEQSLGAPLETMAGASLGPYELLEMLGKGGMGAVFKAKHTRLGKFVAIKVLPAQLTRSLEAVARFDREMKAVGALEHPNIIRAMDADEHHGTHYLVMEYVEGLDLQQFVTSQGALPVSEACRLIRDAAVALEHAHQHGLVHRDIKPSNLLLTKTGQLKVLDLGLARLASDASDANQQTGLTQTGVSLGTPDYMAPEQWSDSHTADHRTDLYALGCTLYFLLVGHPPYGTPEFRTVVGKLTAHTQAPIPSLRAGRAEVPAALDRLYQELLVKDASKRLASAAELAKRLQPFCSKENATTVVRGVPRQPTSTHDPAAPTLDQLSTTVALRPVRSSRNTWLAVGAGALAIVGLVFLVLLNFGKGPDASKAGDNSAHSNSLSDATKSGWQGWPADAPQPALAPFDADQARQHQQEWADYLGVPVEWKNSMGMTFRLIPPGEFLMGAPARETEDLLKVEGTDQQSIERIRSMTPQHKVVISKAFYLGSHEVTQRQYEAVTGRNPSGFTQGGKPPDAAAKVAGLDTGDFPVETVRWIEAAAFCNLLSKQESHSFSYDKSSTTTLVATGNGYRLPTEAEWELACRAGTTTRFWTGDSDASLANAAWTNRNSKARPHPIGQLDPNPFGLFDIHGNVHEYAQDNWDPAFYEQCSGKTTVDPLCLREGQPRVIRGGEWYYAPSTSSSARRLYLPEGLGGLSCGVRVAISVDAVKQALAKVTLSTAGKPWHGWPEEAPAPAIAPFNADQAKQHQKEWAEYLGVPVEWKNAIGMTFRLIPPGEFEMGSKGGETEFPDQTPAHKVTIVKPFYVQTREWTWAESEKLLGDNSPKRPDGVAADAAVDHVSWSEGLQIAKELTVAAMLPPADDTATPAEILLRKGYRLPTEAESEFFCRAGGPALLDMADPATANPFGLFGVYGGMWEWCLDPPRKYKADPEIDPIGTAEIAAHVLRNGSNQDSAYRHTANGDAGEHIGLRLVVSLDAVQEIQGRTENSAK